MSQKVKLIRDHFQNYKRYVNHKAQLVIADIPYNVGKNAYGSNPSWYKDGDMKKGQSDKAASKFFDTDGDFNLAEYFHFCSKLLKKEPKEKGQSPAMLIFCSFEQQFYLIQRAKQYGFNNYINLVFRKNYSPQVLKANMRVVGNAEYALVFYRKKLPKFNNNGKMVFNIMDWPRDMKRDKIHPTQKPVELLQRLIEIFTDKDELVLDPVAGSGSTLIAALRAGRKAVGFEIKLKFLKPAKEWLKKEKDIKEFGYDKTNLENDKTSLFYKKKLDKEK